MIPRVEMRARAQSSRGNITVLSHLKFSAAILEKGLFPASQAKAGQARLSGVLARLTGKMRPGKARQAWPQPSFLGNLGHRSLAFVALFVLRPGFLGDLGQKKARPSWPSRFKPGLARLLWNSRPKRYNNSAAKPGIFPCKIGTGISPGFRRGGPFSRRDPSREKFPPRISARIPPRNLYLQGSRQEKNSSPGSWRESCREAKS